jgi:hypothetical protein
MAFGPEKDYEFALNIAGDAPIAHGLPLDSIEHPVELAAFPRLEGERK